MRKLAYLSPTSISAFHNNQTEFYLNYLSDNRPPRMAQTRPMSVGSAFDAYTKSYLHERLFGKGHDPRFDRQALFEAQVESCNRDWAWEAGAYAFNCYQKSGALADLMLDLNQAVGTPRFELEVRGIVNGRREAMQGNILGVTFLGKPDVFFINKDGGHVILDWKVNGFLSDYHVSPMRGYIRLRDQNGSNKGAHKDASIMSYNGMQINIGEFLETFDEDWARQLAIYGWLCGEDVGSEFIVGIDQVVCKKTTTPNKPDIRIAAHRLRISADFQYKTFNKAASIWDTCTIEPVHFFKELTIEQSAGRCALLDKTAEVYKTPLDDKDTWLVNQG